MRTPITARSASSAFAFAPVAVALLLFAAPAAHAQTVSVIGKAGGYLPVNEAIDIPGQVQGMVVDRKADLALGAAVEISPMFWPVDVRAGAEYLTGTEISVEGTSGEPFPAEGTLLMLSADVVLRPFPRLVFLQPYLLGGLGYKRESFDAIGGASSALPGDYDDRVFHIGVGADLELGGVAVVAEVSDYFAGGGAPGQGLFDMRHDVFASVGLKVGLF